MSIRSSEQIAYDTMRRAGDWPPNAVPTSSQWAAGFRALNSLQQALIAEQVLEQGRTAHDCFVRNHAGLEDAYQRLYARVGTAQMALESVIRGAEGHARCDADTECRICGRMDAAVLLGTALGFLEPVGETETTEDEAAEQPSQASSVSVAGTTQAGGPTP